ncbi:hypothetical protein T492DRAFT_868551 [Pavlovales sp. CCMP2436]|nr:hypothetical protein T492DRAFT_868551 [Pavlovales sp. CCMP2436]
MYALMGVSPMEAAARIKKQLIDTIGTIAARGHAQLLLARLSALAPIAAQRGNTTNSNQQIISLNALARAHYRRSIGTRGLKRVVTAAAGLMTCTLAKAWVHRVFIGSSSKSSIESDATGRLVARLDVDNDLALVNNGVTAQEPQPPPPPTPDPPSLGEQLGDVVQNVVPYIAGSVGVDVALVLISEVGQIGPIKIFGGGLPNLGMVGDLSEAANAQLRSKTEALLKQQKQQAELEAYMARQTELARVTAVVDKPLRNAVADLKPGSAERALASGVLDAVGSISTAPMQIAAVLDTCFTAQQARITEILKTQGAGVAAALQVLTPLNMAGDIIVGGLGGTLADVFAKTPQERARADEVLRLLNPAHLQDLVANVNALLPPSALKLPAPLPLPPPVKTKVCTCPSGTSDAGAQCRRNVTRARERSTCKAYNGNEERARNGLFALCPNGWIPLGVGGRDPYRCRNTAQPSCKEYSTRGGPCPSGYAMLNDSTCWRLENKICA